MNGHRLSPRAQVDRNHAANRGVEPRTKREAVTRKQAGSSPEIRQKERAEKPRELATALPCVEMQPASPAGTVTTSFARGQ
jgi:hypothetical protein